MASSKPLGVTAPISDKLPTDAEKRYSDSLIEELRRQKTFESPSDTQLRHKVLESLQTICNVFVQKIAKIKKPKNEALIRNARGKIFTYGSFRLGVFGPGSDIDTLVVAPEYVLRDDYFQYFPDLLLELAPKGSITDLAVVRDAFVPIIKFEYSGISIDLIFSRIIQTQLSPDLDLKDVNLLRGLDEPELRSLNGTRVTDEILSLVPEQSTFKLALRTIKLWAQRRAVYANIMGFPGGVAWAMLVARVCQLYPKAAVSVVVMKFFKIYKEWQWPQPVLLKPVEDGPLPVRVWNPKIYPPNRYDLMPVITPAYPSMCATYNVTRSTMGIIQKEIERGLDLTLEIMEGKRPWSDMFIKHTFFTKDYKYYMSVISASKTEEHQKIWSGWIESRVRLLVSKLERAPGILHARPFVKSFERRHKCTSDEQLRLVQDGSLDFLAARKKDDEPTDKPNTDEATAKTNDGETTNADIEVFTTTQYIGLELNPDVKSLELSYVVQEFKGMCEAWDRYNTELKDEVSLSVQSLAEDLFEPGEKRPPKPKKGAKKRAAAEDQPPPAKRQHSSVAAAG
ncbi:Poly(A) polymerase [Sarocladium strictum]